MPNRFGISKFDQRNFFQNIKIASKLNSFELSKLCNVSRKTFDDWARAKYTTSYASAIFLSKKFKVSLPQNFKSLEPYWYIKKYARKGALARQKIYGLIGDIETRRKGGVISQQKRRENPEKYRLLGCSVRKSIAPLKKSPELAELFGILLGDGAITNYQIRVTLHSSLDKEYADFVSNLMFVVFGYKPSITKRDNVVDITLSSVNLVEALEKLGLKRGSKVKNQVAIPNWILENKLYSGACLRGLMDTDGGVYFHNHSVRGKRYVNFGLTFGNHSRPILIGVKKILESYNFQPSVAEQRKIYIYKLSEIKRYFKIIDSSNPKHVNRLEHYLSLYEK